MVGNKYEIDGETYIVSDDVNLDELDLEKMVEKGDLAKAVEYVRAYGAVAPPVVQSPAHVPVPVERIWVEMDLRQASAAKNHTFTGIVELMQVGDPFETDSSSSSPAAFYRVRMDRAQALSLGMLAMRSYSGGDMLFVERLRGCHEKLNEELIFRETRRMRFTRFQIMDHKIEDGFVEVEFSVVPM